MKNKRVSLLNLASTMALFASAGQAADITKSADITTSETWTADNVYILTKPVVVKSGVTVTIAPGTLVLAVGDNKGTASRTDDEYGSLVVARGARLIADGTASQPIIFDAYASVYGFDDNGRNTGPSGPRTQPIATRGFPQIQTTNDNGTGTAENPNFGATPAGPGSPLKSGGLWGGVILLGRAPINFWDNDGVTQNFEKTIEGFPVANVDDLKYGATTSANWNADDNSGVLRHLSLRFGGYEFATGSEINGLTLAGVGRGTTIEYVEVVSNNDDGFEFFGGTVNTKYLVSAFNKDDSFDIDEGHQGKHQFWFAIQNNTTTGTYGDNGMELDGGFTPAVSGVDQTNNLAPFTTPDIYNVTIIGKGLNDAGHQALRLRDNFKGKIHNSLFTDLGVTLRGEGTLDASPTSDLPVLNNSIFGNVLNTGFGTYKVSTSSNTTNSGNIASALGANTNTAPTATPILTSISRTANGLLDPRPLSGSVGFTHTRTAVPTALSEDISTVNYNGAFGLALWIDGWTYLSEKGYLPSSGGSSGGEPPFADADNDGVSDTLEATTALTNLGFSVGVNDVSPANRFQNIYSSSSILDVRATGQVTVQAGANDVSLTLPVQKSDTLGGWTNAGNMTLTMPKTSGKEFYRITIPD
jgi:hypothetical protein